MKIKEIPAFIKFLFLVILLNFAYTLAYSSAWSSQPPNPKKVTGEKLFKSNCSGCHLNGQNLIKPDKPIIGSQKLSNKETFRNFLQSPPPPMPNFKNLTLKEESLDALYSYVSSLMGK